MVYEARGLDELTKGVCLLGEEQRKKDLTLRCASFGNQEEGPAVVAVKGQPVSRESSQGVMIS